MIEKSIIKNNLEKIYKQIENGNNLGEPITLIGATKYVESVDIISARDLGLKNVGDNKVQEFRDKTSKIDGLTYHFIGRLQKNKVKYLVGNVALIHSVDSVDLAEEISLQSVKKGVITNVLLEVNCGEDSKGGFSFNEIENAVSEISRFEGISIKGLMAMLPLTKDNEVLTKNCLLLRQIYDKLVLKGYPFEYLSVGMSGDYEIAINNGSNMIRVGTGIFGERDYTKKVY